MTLRHRLIFLLEDFTDFLALPIFLPTMLVGALLPVLVAELSSADSIPAVLVLLAVVWRQWFQMEALRDRLQTLEDKLEEHATTNER